MKAVARGSARTVGWVALLVGVIVALRLAATGDLTAPPLTSLTSLDGLGEWVDAREPAAAAVALVRFVAEIATWYLLGLTVLYGLAAALRWGGAATLADALAAPGAARLVRSGLGLGLLASTAAGAATMDDDQRAVPSVETTATMQPLSSPDAGGRGTAWMVPVAEDESVPPTAPTVTAQRPRTWTVTNGESFWSIADDVLRDASGRAAGHTAIDEYWRLLIDANRDRLIDPDNPDLIHPGQVFELPRP